jgi:hypothetical protein
MALAYYLLPAIAVTLKIRRRKLLSSSPSMSSNIVKSESDLVAFLNVSFDQIIPKEKQLDAVTNSESSGGMKSVDIVTVEKLTFKAFAANLSTKIVGLILQR